MRSIIDLISVNALAVWSDGGDVGCFIWKIRRTTYQAIKILAIRHDF